MSLCSDIVTELIPLKSATAPLRRAVLRAVERTRAARPDQLNNACREEPEAVGMGGAKADATDTSADKKAETRSTWAVIGRLCGALPPCEMLLCPMRRCPWPPIECVLRTCPLFVHDSSVLSQKRDKESFIRFVKSNIIQDSKFWKDDSTIQKFEKL